MSQPNPNERIQVDVRYARFFIINFPVMQCQLKKKKKRRIRAIKGYELRWAMVCFLFSFYLAAGAETRKIYGDVDTDVRSCSMAVLY